MLEVMRYYPVLVDPVEDAWRVVNVQGREAAGLEALPFPPELKRTTNPGPGPAQPWPHTHPESPQPHKAPAPTAPRLSKGGRKSSWTEAEIEIVRVEYPAYRAARKVGELAARLNRSPPSVREMATKIGVAISAAPIIRRSINRRG